MGVMTRKSFFSALIGGSLAGGSAAVTIAPVNRPDRVNGQCPVCGKLANMFEYMDGTMWQPPKPMPGVQIRFRRLAKDRNEPHAEGRRHECRECMNMFVLFTIEES